VNILYRLVEFFLSSRNLRKTIRYDFL